MQDNTQKYDLTQGPIGRKLMVFFLPIALGTIFQQLYNTVDAMVVGQAVGREALAAVGGSASQVVNLCIGFFVALTGGASAVVAQFMGAHSAEKLRQAVHSALAFSILAGIGLTLAGIPLAPHILQWMNTPPETMAQSVLYLRIYFAGIVFVLIFNMGSGILRAVGDSRRPLYYLIACCVCNMILDLLFVVGFQWGVAGAAIATVLSQLLSTILVLRQLCRTGELYRVTLSQIRLHKKVTGQMLRIGVPSGLQESMYNVANLIIQVAINGLGTVTVASWSIATKVDGIYCALSSALGVAVLSFVGQNFGAGNLARVKKTFRTSMKLFMGMTLLMELLLFLMSKYALTIFTDDPEVLACTYQIMVLLIPFYMVWTFIEDITAVLRGVGDAMIPTTITCVGVCAVRLIWVETVFPSLGTITGLLACFPLSWCITAVALSLYFWKGNWLARRLKATEE